MQRVFLLVLMFLVMFSNLSFAVVFKDLVPYHKKMSSYFKKIKSGDYGFYRDNTHNEYLIYTKYESGRDKCYTIINIPISTLSLNDTANFFYKLTDKVYMYDGDRMVYPNGMPYGIIHVYDIAKVVKHLAVARFLLGNSTEGRFKFKLKDGKTAEWLFKKSKVQSPAIGLGIYDIIYKDPYNGVSCSLGQLFVDFR